MSLDILWKGTILQGCRVILYIQPEYPDTIQYELTDAVIAPKHQIIYEQGEILLMSDNVPMEKVIIGLVNKLEHRYIQLTTKLYEREYKHGLRH